MKSLSPRLIDSFLARTSDVFQDSSDGSASCESLGRAWQQLGLRPGDIVLLCLPNGRELLRHFFGVLMACGVPALVAPMTPAARLQELSQTLGAWAVAGVRLPAGEFGARSYASIGHLRVAIFHPPAEPPAAPEQVVVLTSGTSGFASGCVFDINALLLNGERHAESIGQRNQDVVLVNLPLYYSFALVAQALGSLVVGNRLVIDGPPFQVAGYRKVLDDHAVTVSSLTPVLVQPLLSDPYNFPIKTRVLSIGGDALPTYAVGRLLDLRPNGELYLTYGLTQAGPRVSTLAAHAEPPHRHSSVGKPIRGTTIFLRPVMNGGGLRQLYVSSATVMKRPIGQVEGRPNQVTMAADVIATGDLFEQDEHGYLFFKGRLCDYISRRGEKISLAAVRRLASQLPHVVHAKTLITDGEDGHEDFDLVLRLDVSDEAMPNPREALRRLLRRSEMPRNVHIEVASESRSQAYK